MGKDQTKRAEERRQLVIGGLLRPLGEWPVCVRDPVTGLGPWAVVGRLPLQFKPQSFLVFLSDTILPFPPTDTWESCVLT